MLENLLPIDVKYYLENQLANPLMRIFEPILGERKAKDLLSGAYTRTIKHVSTKVRGLMRFAKKAELLKITNL